MSKNICNQCNQFFKTKNALKRHHRKTNCFISNTTKDDMDILHDDIKQINDELDKKQVKQINNKKRNKKHKR